MKRSYNTTQNLNITNAKPNATLEGVVVAVTDISENHSDKKGKYWTALICDVNQNINRITKYLSSKTNCSLHVKLREYLNNQNSVRLNKLKLNGDNTYIATNETIPTPKLLSLIPLCTQITTIKNIQSMSDGEYISFTSKIIDIGSDETIFFNNGPKRIQKLKRNIIVADKTDFINMNIWEKHFNLIEKDKSYVIKLAKVKVFNDDTSITTTTHTIYEPIEDIGTINCSDSLQISNESAITGVITSIGVVEERYSCPKCYSTDIEYNDKTIKCITCKSRSLYVKDSVKPKQIKLNIIDRDQNSTELIVDSSKIETLLERCNRLDLCEGDLVEQEAVLLALSSINVFVNFNRKNMHVNSIVLNDIDDN